MNTLKNIDIVVINAITNADQSKNGYNDLIKEISFRYNKILENLYTEFKIPFRGAERPCLSLETELTETAEKEFNEFKKWLREKGLLFVSKSQK